MTLEHRLSRLLLITALSAGAWPALTHATEPLRLNTPQYEAEALKLRSAQPRSYDFAKARLSDVLRFIATDAGLSFISLPDSCPEANRLITFSLNASPFEALEMLCRANALTLVLNKSVWYIRPWDDKDLLSLTYELKSSSFADATKRATLIEDLRAILDMPADGTPSTSGPAPTAKAQWKANSNTLEVQATRLQHLWVAGYLFAADKAR